MKLCETCGRNFMRCQDDPEIECVLAWGEREKARADSLQRKLDVAVAALGEIGRCGFAKPLTVALEALDEIERLP